MMPGTIGKQEVNTEKGSTSSLIRTHNFRTASWPLGMNPRLATLALKQNN